MNTISEKLLKDKRVVAEIERHLWLESERIGTDIGFDAAKEDWLKNFSKVWMQYHMPESTKKTQPAASKTKSTPKKDTKVAPKIKRRRAKSYL